MSTSKRDDEAVQRFIESFASELADSGWQRMPARVFAALMTEDSGSMTAADLAERLQISAAAVSGAVRYLTQIHMVIREREPGTRRDVYRVRNEVWHDAIFGRERALTLFEARLAEGAAALGTDTPAGRRLVESAEFFTFMQRELIGMMERWRERLDEIRADYSD
ncbi:GbsR/MarR family transcriptional regulator [Spirillospora sp. CA-294931]|uniref:GbsR/MarR family transcriptional regulator n=1 Tax=Spirillospora sp. CA-294931 TaxID=3240042 RepID=UPI003D8C452E